MKLFILLLLISNMAFATDIIIKDPTTVTTPIRASGYDARDGENGRDGSDGRCTYNDESDSYNSDRGEDGQDGGDGGYGYDGDNVLIYYKTLDQLKNIIIYSYGGDGGKGGKGGRGGKGCHGGNDGSDGRDGRDGSSGSRGYLQIIKSSQTYIADITSESTTIEKLLTIPITFRKNYWNKKDGAYKLIDERSEIQSSYYEFEKVNTTEVSVIWNTEKEKEFYKNININLGFDGETITVNFLGAVADYKITKKGNKSLIEIMNIYKKDELLDFLDFKLSNDSQNLQLTFEAKSPDLKLDQLSFGLELYKKVFLTGIYTMFYKTYNTSGILVLSDKQVQLNIGKLPIKTRLVKRNKKIQINIQITVDIFGQKMSKTFYLDHKVGSGVTNLN